MKRCSKIVILFLLSLAIWIFSIPLPLEHKIAIPFVILLLGGIASIIQILKKVSGLSSCPDEKLMLEKDIERSKEFYRIKKVRFENHSWMLIWMTLNYCEFKRRWDENHSSMSSSSSNSSEFDSSSSKISFSAFISLKTSDSCSFLIASFRQKFLAIPWILSISSFFINSEIPTPFLIEIVKESIYFMTSRESLANRRARISSLKLTLTQFVSS